MSDAAKDGFATRLRMALGYANINRRELARQLGVSPQAVAKWTSGQAYPSAEHLVQICKVCGVTMSWMFEGGDPFDQQETIDQLRGDLKRALNELYMLRGGENA